MSGSLSAGEKFPPSTAGTPKRMGIWVGLGDLGTGESFELEFVDREGITGLVGSRWMDR